MATSLERVQLALARLGDRGRTTRVPDAIRSVVMAYTREQRRRDRSWRAIASEVGLSASGLQRWSSRRPRRRSKPALVPVRVEAPVSAQAVAVVMPSGVRLEGLSLDDAVTVLRQLA